ncbi:hypothetical protein, partial [Deinococcus sp. 14RED07]|uniref:hypothetical protein n=1 Tax=Deinococcus sp. 14RED07 TaxID=2745874 RepID=UPI001E28BF77
RELTSVAERETTQTKSTRLNAFKVPLTARVIVRALLAAQAGEPTDGHGDGQTADQGGTA